MSVCAICKDSLMLAVEGDPDEVIPDDLLLPCGCHFHWQCLLDEATQVANSIQCPSCASYLAANPPAAAAAGSSSSSSAPAAAANVQILTRYVNEGGLQENYDIFPDITEEAYFLAHPEARKAQSFLIMCGSGDIEAIVGLLSDDDDDDDDDDEEPAPKLSPEDLIRYQDPLQGLRSGLHVAIENDQEEVVYLLLYLASRLPLDRFPPAVLAAAEQMSLPRPASVATHADIRSLHDQRGQTAAAYAAQKGGAWAALAQTGLLTAA